MNWLALLNNQLVWLTSGVEYTGETGAKDAHWWLVYCGFALAFDLMQLCLTIRHSLQREELSTIVHPKDEFDLFGVSFHVSCIKMMNDIFEGFLPQRLLELPGNFFFFFPYFFSICKRISGRCSSCPDGLGCHGSQQGLHEGCKGVKPLLNWEKVTVASTRQLKVTSQLGLPSVDVELYCFLTITLLLSAGLAM